MKTILIIAGLAIATTAWAGQMHEGKQPPGKMMFEKMDTNQDGAISVEEHEAGLQKMQERHRARFSTMDTNGDGMLTKEEAKTARENMGEKRREHRRECKEDNK